MYALLTLSLSLIFLILAVLHFRWALNSNRGVEKVLPTNESGERILNPTSFDSVLVGLGLLFFASFYFVKSDIISFSLPVVMNTYGGWVISMIFIGRAIGDFRYVGFFKRIRNTSFGRQDTLYYSPLCIFIGMVGVTIELNPFA